MRPTPATILLLFGLAFIAALLTGCVERTIKITSEPPGALVYLNDEEVGRTPCRTEFTYYGTYDVRLVLDGYEPYLGPGEMDTPIHQWPAIDLVAEILPMKFSDTVEWHFDLRQVNDDPAAMLDRALQLRARMHERDAEAEPTSDAKSDEEASEMEKVDQPQESDPGRL